MNSNHSFFRFSFVGIVIVLLPVAVILQILRIQLDPAIREEFLQLTRFIIMDSRELEPTRGQILDRWGNLLAGNTTVYEVGIYPAEAQKWGTVENIAKTLNTLIGEDYNSVIEAATPPTETLVYNTITNYVPKVELEGLAKILDDQKKGKAEQKDVVDLTGLELRPHLVRTYPEGSLAFNVLGFVDLRGQAFHGVEAKYDDMLAGEPKKVQVPLDPNRAQELPTVPVGASMILTIDRAVQQMVESVLDDAVSRTGSKTGTIVVMDPRTGEVLAMAVTPRLNLNKYWDIKKVFSGDPFFNRAISQPYEPGSVFKVLTMSIGFDLGVVDSETVFIDTGAIEVGGWTIRNWDGGAWGPQTMQGCMQHSLNVCLAWVATQIGAPNFYAYLQAFGIGRLTGVDLAGEARGVLWVPSDNYWNAVLLGTNAFGQGVSTTPIQMASAISAVANRGMLMAPHVVRSIVDDGRQYDIEIRMIGSVIKPETAILMSEMLASSLEIESSTALVPGYRVAGKTGTAEIPTDTGYHPNLTNASFVGWGPVDDPQFLVYIWLEHPTSDRWGSVVAAPVFSEVVQKLVVLLNIPPDAIRLKMKGQ